MKSISYMERAMRSRDPRYARVLGKLGYGRRDMRATEVVETPRRVQIDPLDHDGDGRKGGSPKIESSQELIALRDEYERALGKKPFSGWDADTLRAKISAHR